MDWSKVEVEGFKYRLDGIGDVEFSVEEEMGFHYACVTFPGGAFGEPVRARFMSGSEAIACLRSPGLMREVMGRFVKANHVTAKAVEDFAAMANPFGDGGGRGWT